MMLSAHRVSYMVGDSGDTSSAEPEDLNPLAQSHYLPDSCGERGRGNFANLNQDYEFSSQGNFYASYLVLSSN